MMLSQLREVLALSLREITREIDQAGCPSSPVIVAQTTTVPTVLTPLLDIKAAERLPNRNLIFAAEPGRNAWEVEPAWHVFSRRLSNPDNQILSFTQAGVIQGGLGDDAFIRHAYDIILRRQADPDGHRAYRDVLQSGHQTRYGLLRELAGSIEASQNGWQIVVVPSSWIAAGQIDMDEALPNTVYVERREFDTTVAVKQEGLGRRAGTVLERVAPDVASESEGVSQEAAA